jgi:hypothetical protein
MEKFELQGVCVLLSLASIEPQVSKPKHGHTFSLAGKLETKVMRGRSAGH